MRLTRSSAESRPEVGPFAARRNLAPWRNPGGRFALLILLGAGLRLLLVGLTQALPQLQPADARGYDDRAWALVGAWRSGETSAGLDLPFSVFGAAWTRYDELVAAVYAVVGHHEVVVQLVNAVAGVLAAVAARSLARRQGSALGGDLAAALILLLPSFLYFTSLNLKEAVVLYATLGALLWFGELLAAPSVGAALLLVACVALLTFVRAQAGLLFAVAAALAWWTALRGRRSIAAAVAGWLVVAGALALLGAGGQLGYLTDNLSLARLTVDRVAQAELAGSQLGPAGVIATPAEALRYLPLGLVYFFLAPFPWQVGGPFGVAAVFEMVLWYLLLPFAAVGLAGALRRGDRAAWVALGFVAVYAVAAALAVGNVGGLYRYRLPIWAILFVWVDVGVGSALPFVFTRLRIQRQVVL